MKFTTNYPFVLVHGMLGYGKDEMVNKMIPYWGMLSGNLMPYLENWGFEVYNPSIGKYSSNWDRACELWAQLVGGTVDYGVAHSKKYGHKRFGRTYKKPLFEGFGPDKKINLVGHSLGGPTIRLFATLMADGSKEEQEATPEDELSDLFKGGKEDWIFSISAVASVQEGTTLAYSMQKAMHFLELFTYFFANITGNNPLGMLYESHMEQWGLIEWEDGKIKSKSLDVEKWKKIQDSRDNVWSEITLKGAKEVNKQIRCLKNVYYFSWPCCKSSQMFFMNKLRHTPRFIMSPLFWGFSHSIGKYSENKVDDYPIDERWLPNDGLVPTIAQLAPSGEPYVYMRDLKGDPKKGVWNIYDVVSCDHLGIVGGLLLPTSASKLQPIYLDRFGLINKLKK